MLNPQALPLREAPALRRPLVVVVDDDPRTLSALERCLRDEPYEVLATHDPLQAREWLRQMDVALVVTDEFMPEMRGTELLEEARRRSPRTGVILLTGYPNPTVTYRGFLLRVDLLLRKPWDNDQLRNSIASLLESKSTGEVDPDEEQPGG